MTILQIAGAYKPAFVYGGPTRSVTALCTCLQDQGVFVHVLTTTANGKSDLDVKTNTVVLVDNVPVKYFKRWTGDHTHFSPGLLWAVFRACRNYDIVHIHGWWHFSAIPAALICLLRGVVPVISPRGTLSDHSFENNHTSVKYLLHRFLGKQILRKSIIHATSHKELSEIAGIVNTNNIWEIPNLLPLPVANAPFHQARMRKLDILFIGRIHPVKNIELLIEALKSLSDSIVWTLEIVGDGEQVYVERLKKKTKLLKEIRWCGEMDGSVKFEKIRRSDLLILLSHTENFGNVVIEALSQGTAVLVSSSVGISKYVLENQLGWVVEPDTKATISILTDIAEDVSSRNAIRERGPQYIMRDFGPEALTSRYLEMYASH